METEDNRIAEIPEETDQIRTNVRDRIEKINQSFEIKIIPNGANYLAEILDNSGKTIDSVQEDSRRLAFEAIEKKMKSLMISILFRPISS